MAVHVGGLAGVQMTLSVSTPRPSKAKRAKQKPTATFSERKATSRACARFESTHSCTESICVHTSVSCVRECMHLCVHSVYVRACIYACVPKQGEEGRREREGVREGGRARERKCVQAKGKGTDGRTDGRTESSSMLPDGAVAHTSRTMTIASTRFVLTRAIPRDLPHSRMEAHRIGCKTHTHT